MSEEKIVIPCPNPTCKNAIRIPIREAIIKFRCPHCGNIYYAQKGQIIDYVEKKDPPPQSQVAEPSEPGKSNEPVKPTQPTSSSQADPSSSPRPPKQPSPKTKSTSTSRKPVPFFRYFWPALSVGLLFYCLYLQSIKKNLDVVPDQDNMDSVTVHFLSALKNGKDRHFEEAKTFMAKQTLETFQFVVESQFPLHDTAASKVIDRFINSIQPLEYVASRRFQYLNIDSTVGYFSVVYLPSSDGYKLELNKADFLK